MTAARRRPADLIASPPSGRIRGAPRAARRLVSTKPGRGLRARSHPRSHRRQLAAPPRVPRAAGDDDRSRRPAHQRRLRLRLDAAQAHRVVLARRAGGRLRQGPPEVPLRRARALQDPSSAHARGPAAAVRHRQGAARGDERPGRGVRGLGGRRPARHLRPARRAGRHARAAVHRRQGRLPAGDRPDQRGLHQEGHHRHRGLRPCGGRGAARRPPRPGGRLPGPQGRHLRQHPRRARHRREDRREAHPAVRFARRGARARGRGPRQGGGEPAREHRGGAAEPHRGDDPSRRAGRVRHPHLHVGRRRRRRGVARVHVLPHGLAGRARARARQEARPPRHGGANAWRPRSRRLASRPASPRETCWRSSARRSR